VTSDHGFSTHTGTLTLETLVEPFARSLPDGSKDIVVAEGAIHFRTPDPGRVAGLVAVLQRRPEVGAIFTRANRHGDTEGTVPGTLSFDVARWNHARSGDILVSANWTDEANAAGIKGTTTQGGVAGHGTSSPFDIHNTLIAAGPDVKSGLVSEVPTCTIDLAPTICQLLGITPTTKMDGRVMKEALKGGPDPKSVMVLERTYNSPVKPQNDPYEVDLHESGVDGVDYFDFTKIKRAK